MFEEFSILNLTYEINVNDKLSFLDVMVNMKDGSMNTNGFKKNTDTSYFLNADSHCSQKYKDSVITSYINMAYKVSENWNAFHSEVKAIKQMLVNNNFTNTNIDKVINKFLFKIHTADDNNKKSRINIYYKTNFTKTTKQRKKLLKIL